MVVPISITVAGSMVPGHQNSAGTRMPAVAPRVHIAEQTCFGNAGELLRQEHLQVADRIFLSVAAAGVSEQPLAWLGSHAHEVSGFVQDGVNGGILARVQVARAEPGLGVAPVASGNSCAHGNAFQTELEASQQCGELGLVDVVESQDVHVGDCRIIVACDRI